MRCIRAQARTTVAIRSRTTAACSKRSAADKRASRARSGSTSGRTSPDQAAPNELDECVVGLRRLTALARRGAPPDAGQDAGGAHRSAQRQPVGALAQRHGVVDRVAYRLGLAVGAQRAEIGRAVGADRVHDRQPRKRLVGELEPDGPLGKLRAAVVARLVRGDQPQLAHLRLERVRALDRVDALGQADHLAHPAAGLAGDEVLPHPGAQVAARADVERRALRVAEDVDARHRWAGRRRGGACGAARRETWAVNARSSGKRLHAEAAEPADAARAARRRWPARRPARGGSARSWRGRTGPAWPACSWAPRRGSAPAGRARRCRRPRSPATRSRAPAGRLAGSRRRTGRCARPARCRAANSRNDGSTAPIVGAPETIASVMPVSTLTNGVIADARVDEGLELAEHLPAANLDRADLGDRVVAGAAAGGLEVDDGERGRRAAARRARPGSSARTDDPLRRRSWSSRSRPGR